MSINLRVDLILPSRLRRWCSTGKKRNSVVYYIHIFFVFVFFISLLFFFLRIKAHVVLNPFFRLLLKFSMVLKCLRPLTPYITTLQIKTKAIKDIRSVYYFRFYVFLFLFLMKTKRLFTLSQSVWSIVFN